MIYPSACRYRPAGGTFETCCALTDPPHHHLHTPGAATSWASCLGDRVDGVIKHNVYLYVNIMGVFI